MAHLGPSRRRFHFSNKVVRNCEGARRVAVALRICCSREPGFVTGSERPVALDRDPTAGARLRIIVPERLMLEASVVPQSGGMRLPAETHLEFLPRAEL